MSRHTNISAHKNSRGDSLITAQQTSTDAPLIPVGEVERLHALNPAYAQFIFDQTRLEAEHRRHIQSSEILEQSRVNGFIFIERIAGVIAAVLVGIAAIVGGIYVVIHGHDWAGASIAGVGIGTLAVAFIHKKERAAKAENNTTKTR